MALNPELITAQETLKGLSEDQISTIVTLSKNDEETVIGTRIGELHGQYDNDVLSVTGINRNQGEKTYDYVKRVLGDYKTKAEAASALETTISDLNTKIQGYEKTIAEGKGNETIAKQLKDAQDRVAALENQYNTDKANWEKEKGEYSVKEQKILLNVEFDKALSSLKFKKEFTPAVVNALVKSAKDEILGTAKPDWIDDGKGGKVLVFRDQQGSILNNPENQLNPYTLSELLAKNLSDALEISRKVTGGNTKEGETKDGISLVDIGQATTQVAADELIVKHLLQTGYIRGTEEFAKKQMEIRLAQNVNKLPLR
jgi:hypothetical protein